MIQPKHRHVTSFRGALATAGTPISTDTDELNHVDRSGQVIYRMYLNGILNDEELLRR